MNAKGMRRKTGFLKQFDLIIAALEKLDETHDTCYGKNYLEWGVSISHVEKRELEALGFRVQYRNPSNYTENDGIWTLISW